MLTKLQYVNLGYNGVGNNLTGERMLVTWCFFFQPSPVFCGEAMNFCVPADSTPAFEVQVIVSVQVFGRLVYVFLGSCSAGCLLLVVSRALPSPLSLTCLFPTSPFSLCVCLSVCLSFVISFFSLFSPCCPHRCRRDPCQGLREDAALGVALHDGQPEACRFVSLSSAAYPRCLELNYVGIYFEHFSNIRMCFLCVTGAVSSFIALTSLVGRFRVKHGTGCKFSSL